MNEIFTTKFIEYENVISRVSPFFKSPSGISIVSLDSQEIPPVFSFSCFKLRGFTFTANQNIQNTSLGTEITNLGKMHNLRCKTITSVTEILYI